MRKRKTASVALNRNKPNQRVGSVSNSQVGADFELVALTFFEKRGVKLSRNFAVEVGISDKKKHCFDLGAANPKLSLNVSHISGRRGLMFRARK